MGQWILRKAEAANIRSLCAACGINPQKKTPRKSKKYGSQQLYLSICTGCRKRLQKKKVWIAYSV